MRRRFYVKFQRSGTGMIAARTRSPAGSSSGRYRTGGRLFLVGWLVEASNPTQGGLSGVDAVVGGMLVGSD